MNSGQLQHIALAKLTRADILEWWEHVSWDFPDKYAQNHKGYIRLCQAFKQAVVQGWCLGEGIEGLAWGDVHFADKQ